MKFYLLSQKENPNYFFISSCCGGSKEPWFHLWLF